MSVVRFLKTVRRIFVKLKLIVHSRLFNHNFFSEITILTIHARLAVIQPRVVQIFRLMVREKGTVLFCSITQRVVVSGQPVGKE